MHWLLILILILLSSAPALSQQISVENYFAFTYQVKIDSIPQNTRDLKIWIPLARSDQYQKILSFRIDSPYPYAIFEDLDYRNKILYLSLEKAPVGRLDLKIHYEVRVKGKRQTYEDLRDNHSSRVAFMEGEDDFKLYLASQSLLVVNDRVRAIAREVTKGKTDDLEKAKVIYDYVIANMTYDKSGDGWGRGSTVHACEVKKGNCTDFHSLFISMARASGIPARFKIGAQIPHDQARGTIGYHCWAEFYLAGRGWIPVDTSEAWKHSELREFYFGSYDGGKFFINLGRDISLEPVQKGEPVNIFIDPYVELDGKPLHSVKSQFYFKKRSEK